MMSQDYVADVSGTKVLCMNYLDFQIIVDKH